VFTGLVEEVGHLLDRNISPAGSNLLRLRIQAPKITAPTVTGVGEGGHAVRPGDSVCVSGCCVTVVEMRDQTFYADLVPETLRRTILGELRIGCPVNLERAVPADGRLDGHIVQGHVDGTGRVATIDDGPGWRRLRIELPAELAPLVAEKGSIAVDGVSLTVALVGPSWFEVELIPATLAATAFGEGPHHGALAAGAEVNLEVDVVARHLARLAQFATMAVPA
jgi:riboflavin synthase